MVFYLSTKILKPYNPYKTFVLLFLEYTEKHLRINRIIAGRLTLKYLKMIYNTCESHKVDATKNTQ